MTRKVIHILTLLLITCACRPHETIDNIQTDSFQKIHNDTINLTDSKNNINNTKLRADIFIQTILDTNARHSTFQKADKNLPSYLYLFEHKGLDSIHAYSSKRYPENTKPFDYPHFVLFLLQYKNKEFAVAAFNQFTKDTESFDVEQDQLTDNDYKRIRHIHGFSKYGGFVGQKDNSIFSLVETCGGPGPYRSKTWSDYEQLFVKSIFDLADSNSIVLNADCGGLKYRKQSAIQLVPNSLGPCTTLPKVKFRAH